MNVERAIAIGTEQLNNGGGDPRREAASLLAFALGRDRTFLVAHTEYLLSDEEATLYLRILDRRASREPLQYITGRQEFWGLEFFVTPDVLIPRPETEILVEEAVRLLQQIEDPRFCDAATGSGCVAIAILHSVPSATAVATDISAAALAVAEQNARKHDAADRLEFVRTDVLDGVPGMFDLIVSNPPYIPDAQIETLEPEVRDHEPRLALSGGEDGLVVVNRVIESSAEILRPGASLLVEIGFDQSETVRELFTHEIWQSVEFLPDLQGIPRIAKAIRN